MASSAPPSSSLTGHTALVCGASGGIGRATALALAAAGARVIALARSADKLASLLTEIEAIGAPPAMAIVADLDDRVALEGRIDALLAEIGVVHVLINNSGGPPGGPLLEASAEDFLLALGRHLLASHLLAQKLVPGMIAAGFGRIINIISTSVYEPIPGLGVSNTVRGAMASWAKSLSRELPPGISINNVLPGFTDTPRLTSLAAGRAVRSGTSPEAVREAWIEQVPEGRLIRPEETAAAVAFLASPAGAAIRGISLAVDGGRLRGI